MGYICVKCGKKKELSNCFALLVLLSFCKTSAALLMIQKQFTTPVFLAIPSLEVLGDQFKARGK